MSKHHKLCKEDYRKIWRDVNGEIPKGYHIHHVDGNPYNNDISNLVCVSPEEHAELHQNEFAKWATIGGKMGGEKARDEKLGWFAASLEQRIEWSSGPKREVYGEECTARLKADYASGKRKHWTTLYSAEEVSIKISSGDPGKARRGKPSPTRGKKLVLKDRESTNNNKRAAALSRDKYECECCGKKFDGGNLKRHQKAKGLI